MEEKTKEENRHGKLAAKMHSQREMNYWDGNSSNLHVGSNGKRDAKTKMSIHLTRPGLYTEQ